MQRRHFSHQQGMLEGIALNSETSDSGHPETRTGYNKPLNKERNDHRAWSMEHGAWSMEHGAFTPIVLSITGGMGPTAEVFYK